MKRNSLKNIRKERNLTLSKLSRKLHISKTVLCNFENMNNNISIDILYDLAEFLDVDLNEILKQKFCRYFGEKDAQILYDVNNITTDLYQNLEQKDLLLISRKLYEIILEYQSLDPEDDVNIKALRDKAKNNIIIGLAWDAFFKKVLNKESQKEKTKNLKLISDA